MLLVVSDGDIPESENGYGLQADDWEHVSVSAHQKRKGKITPRTPTWDEMCYAKSLFWDSGEAVIQFHPPASKYVNQVSYVLHLWKHRKIEQPVPNPLLVGK